MKKNLLILFVAILPFLASSCKKPEANFTFYTSSDGTKTKVYTQNRSLNADWYSWSFRKNSLSYYEIANSTNKNPVFDIPESGSYELILEVGNKNGEDLATESFSVTLPSGGSGGGSGNQYTHYTITSLILQKIPMTDTDNSSWDTGLLGGADPDIFFKILNSSSSTLYTSATKQNVASSDFPVTWSAVNKSLDYSENYIIRFYDEDGDLDPNDLMAGCSFNSSYLTPGSSSYTWVASDGTIKFTVGLTWSRGGYENMEDFEVQTAEETDTIIEK